MTHGRCVVDMLQLPRTTDQSIGIPTSARPGLFLTSITHHYVCQDAFILGRPNPGSARPKVFLKLSGLLGISASPLGFSPAGVCLHSHYHLNTILAILRPKKLLVKKVLIGPFSTPPLDTTFAQTHDSSLQYKHHIPNIPATQQDATTETLRIPQLDAAGDA